MLLLLFLYFIGTIRDMFQRIKDRVVSWSRFRRIRAWYKKYERYLLPAALLIGFIGDTIAVRTIDLDIIRFILLGHIVIAATGILIVNLPDWRVQGRIMRYVRLFMPLAIQYAFGALFSIFIVLYSHSGALSISWPFILVLTVLFVGTELFKKQYERLLVQVGALSFALLSYLVLFVPHTIRAIGPLVFIASGLIGALVMYGYIVFTARIAPRIRDNKTRLFKVAGGIIAIVYLLYFLNLIPPFPLSLRDAGVYYSVERAGEEYSVIDERDRWYEVFLPFDVISISSPGETLFLYSAVFAPANLSTDVVHEWYRHDPDHGWRRVSRVSFPMVGGRDAGYRGYSYHSGVSPGWWRVEIKTLNGGVIGVHIFRVIESAEPIEKEEKREI